MPCLPGHFSQFPPNHCSLLLSPLPAVSISLSQLAIAPRHSPLTSHRGCSTLLHLRSPASTLLIACLCSPLTSRHYHDSLSDKKLGKFLFTVHAKRKVDPKKIAGFLGLSSVGNFRFASAETLQELLGVAQASRLLCRTRLSLESSFFPVPVFVNAIARSALGSVCTAYCGCHCGCSSTVV